MKNYTKVLLAGSILSAAMLTWADDDSIERMPLSYATPAIDASVAKGLNNPIPPDKSSIERGHTLYRSLGCANCHGTDGKALIEVSGNATDLTSPDFYQNGSSEGEIFRSIRDGAGVAMPPHKGRIKESEDIWHLVNYIQSLWESGNSN